MQVATDTFLPPLMEVEERPDARQSRRTQPLDVSAEVIYASEAQPLRGPCLNLSQHGFACLTDSSAVTQGMRVTVNLTGNGQQIAGLTGTVVRVDQTGRFSEVAVAFGESQANNTLLEQLTRL